MIIKIVRIRIRIMIIKNDNNDDDGDISTDFHQMEQSNKDIADNFGN